MNDVMKVMSCRLCDARVVPAKVSKIARFETTKYYFLEEEVAYKIFVIL